MEENSLVRPTVLILSEEEAYRQYRVHKNFAKLRQDLRDLKIREHQEPVRQKQGQRGT